MQLNGQATDPGSNDQATLEYTWTFDDGTPSATGGPGAAHAYATPGDYTATLTVTATLVDEYGRPVVGASADTGLTFVIGNK